MSDLARRRETYTGVKAKSYERTRQGGFWDREQAAMTRVLATVPHGATLLDVPVGTGRFLPLYAERSLKVVGVDKSEDMLAEARKKSRDAVLQTGDLFDLVFPPGHFDYAVCVRLLNWLETDELPPAFSELGRVARTVIAGAGTKHGNVKLRSVQRIHEERDFLAAVETAGLKVLGKNVVEHNDRGMFHFWTLGR